MKMGIRTGLSVAAIAMATAGFSSQAHADAAACNGLSQRAISAAAIGLPTGGGKVTSAEFIAAKDDLPAYCKVLGAIAPLDPKATPVLFQVNLPDNWNKKAVQYGGGAMNGTVTTGLGPLPIQPPTAPLALARGFITLGNDGGHPVVRPDTRVFMQNDEAFANHAYGAYKKNRDAAADLASAYYGQKVAHFYYIGSSEGGREGLVMAQRFPKDYSGIAAIVPVVGWTPMMLAHYDMWQHQRDGIWFSPAQIKLLQQTTDGACDELDGLKDGVVSNYLGCNGKVNVVRMQCSDPQQSNDSCLSARHVRFLNDMHGGLKLDYALTGGVRGFPGWGWGGEAQPGGFSPWRQPAAKPPHPDMGLGQNGTGFLRYAVTNDLGYVTPKPYNQHRQRIQAVSAMMDAAPELAAFQARGGKILMIENTADYAQAPAHGYAYYNAVVKKLGQARTDGFFRLYVSPGLNHGSAGVAADGSVIPAQLDMLGVIDSWADQGQAPGTLTVASYTGAAPFQVVATKPLCRYPTYPRYKAGSDAKQAAGYTCAR